MAVEEPDGRQWVDFEVGDRSENDFAQRYGRSPDVELYYIYDYAVYGERLPWGRHISARNGEVNWCEGLHSWRRDKLNQLARRTKGTPGS